MGLVLDAWVLKVECHDEGVYVREMRFRFGFEQGGWSGTARGDKRSEVNLRSKGMICKAVVCCVVPLVAVR